ncbi:hypothetical protein [Mycoplasma hafezii]|uniref:hypothetical protein n=1 Tax=Mycoplasma hafezii TaxID=525886 RepID=UPI003CFA42AB
MLKPSEYGSKNTIAELWAHEKDTFRPWIISLGVGILIILGLTITMTIYPAVKINELAKETYDYLMANNQGNLNITETAVKQLILYNYIMNNAFMCCAIIGAAAWYGVGIYKSYKAKDFSQISNVTLIVIMILGFWNLITLLSMIFSGSYVGVNFQADNTVKVYWALNITTVIATVVVWIFLEMPVAKIRRAFLFIHKKRQAEAAQKAFMEWFGNLQNNPNANANFDFNQFSQTAQKYDDEIEKDEEKNPETTDNEKADDKKSPEELKKQKEIKRLLSLPNEQLEEIAKMLNIYGYQSMSKQELAEIIYNYATEMGKQQGGK